ncbi:MAG: quinolinate synthase NadA [Planctomycetaceae bacterium]|jgi:quinolinate synthase|nr:quinolinate synthase NadA [Planctomycetaceae bacterium]
MYEIIQSAKKRLGKRLLILGHHYQHEDVLAHADLIGDSFQLSRMAAERSVGSSGECESNSNCEFIIFCGVHFMAETADILANSPANLAKRDGRRVDVILPDLLAGCSMADMASYESVLDCWNQLANVIDIDEVVPVTYVNSSAELKAFCGERGGIACTSGNARAVLEWALSNKQQNGQQKRKRVLFFPDQHLGQNTALAMGIPMSEMVFWKSDEPELGGNNIESIKRSRILLWDGFCCVHQKFLPGHVDEIRNAIPNVRVIVHPECKQEVVTKADEAGSTAYILKRITESPAGSCWAVGTEGRFVERIAKQNPDKTIVNLAFQPSYCSTMGLITTQNFAAMFPPIEQGKPINIIKVNENIAQNALIALQKMLETVF